MTTRLVYGIVALQNDNKQSYALKIIGSLSAVFLTVENKITEGSWVFPTNMRGIQMFIYRNRNVLTAYRSISVVSLQAKFSIGLCLISSSEFCICQ